MTLKIRRTGASDYGKYIKALVFGEPGAGKTLISSTFPNPLYASAEGGLMSIADRNIPYVEIRSTDDLLQIKNSISQDPDVREQIFGFPIDTIVIDTIDEIQKIMIQERLKASKSNAMQLQDWGWLSEQMQAMVRGFRNIPIHVVFTCHIKEVSDNDSGRVWYKPGLQGSIADSIPGYVDLSLLIQSQLVNETVDGKLKKVEKRSLITAPSLKYPFLKDRSGKLPAELDINFTDDFDRINELIFGGVKLKEGEEYEVQTPQLTDAPPLAEPEPEPEPVKPIETKAPPVKERKEEKPVDEVENNDSSIKMRNKLPDGITPTPKGYGTDYYCVECGGEVETEQRVKYAKIRHRRVLDDACYDVATNNKKEAA